jgi:uncharacterized protein
MKPQSTPPAAFSGGALIGTLGGLIGLGGAEFRLPLLIGAFKFPPLEAIVLNKAVSLVVVVSAFVFRQKSIPLEDVVAYWTVVFNLLAGSLLGAWFGASWATRMQTRTLYRVIALLLVAIAIVLVASHSLSNIGSALLQGTSLRIAGVVAGFVIGIVASLMGVAGGELLIPTLVLLFGIDIKLAGSLALAISFPTMLIGLSRYSQDVSFAVLSRNRSFFFSMAAGSVAGAFIGGLLLGQISNSVLYPLLAAILLISAVKVWQRV